MPDTDKSESGMITYLIQPVFRSDFYPTEIQARIESVYRLISYQVIAQQFCIICMSVFSLESDRSESDLNISWLCKNSYGFISHMA